MAFSAGVVTLDTGGTIQVYGVLYVEWDSQATVRDDLSVESGGNLTLNDTDTMFTIEGSGAVFAYGTFATSWGARCELLGYLGVASTGLLSVSSGGLINVYKDIRLGGRLTGGGKIVMLRREGRILDFNDNPAFVLDRAYGFGVTRAA